MWIHLYDPHAPYDPPTEFREKHPADAYGAEIAFVDDLVGKLISTLKTTGRYGSTVLTVIADHGEALGEHGEQTHAILLHQATIHVPWILRVPKHEKGMRFPFPVGSVDLAPTLAWLTDIPTPNADFVDGRSLLEMSPIETQENRNLYYEAMLPMYQYGWSSLRGLRNGRWEVISGTRDEVFNLQRDPRELVNVADAENLELQSLRAKLDTFIDEDNVVDDDSLLEVQPSERQALAALGYVTTSSAPRREGLDPRDMIRGHVQLENSRSLVAAGRFADALAGIDAMLSDDPENLAALALKAHAQIELGDLNDADTTLRKILDLDPKNSEAVAGLCRIEMQRGHPDKAIELARFGASTRSPFGVFGALEARALMTQQRFSDAERVVDKALDHLPDDPDLLSVRAALFARAGKSAEAEAALRRAVSSAPYHRQCRRQLGQLLMDSGRRQDAIEIYENLLTISPGDAEALFAVGTILLPTSPSDAVPYLEEAARIAPGKAVNLMSLGVVYIQTNRASEAESALRRAIELEPDNPQIKNNLAIALIQKGDGTQAVEQPRDRVG
jgi:Flp pilus assembly protein TadD